MTRPAPVAHPLDRAPAVPSRVRPAPASRSLALALALPLAAGLGSCTGMGVRRTVNLALGDSTRVQTERAERERDADATPTRRGPSALVIALDGVGRDTLARAVDRGDMPALVALLGGREPGGRFPHAYLADDVLSVLPSTTLACWASVFTGLPVAQHGVAGNEFFVRERDAFVAPGAVSVPEQDHVAAVYTDRLLDPYLGAPTTYELVARADPLARSWVAMNFVYRGADVLILPRRRTLLSALAFPANALLEDEGARGASYRALDEHLVANVVEELARHPAPAVLTVYLPGADLTAHVSDAGPEAAQAEHLREVVDPALARVRDALARRDALRDRYVIVVADHGHTAVVADDEHALRRPPADVLARAGFRVRPFRLSVEAGDHQAVLAYQGATAYVYLADRSRCARPGARCAWALPPRYDADVLPAAEAFFQAGARGAGSAAMRGAIDLVLTRRPRPFAEDDAPFEVYVGRGRTVPLERYLAATPRPEYPRLAERLRGLAVGRYGERAGDVLIVAHNGDRADPRARYYFDDPARSWHGSPSLQDSAVPFVLAHPARDAAALEREARAALGDAPSHTAVTPLVARLLAPRPARDLAAAAAR